MNPCSISKSVYAVCLSQSLNYISSIHDTTTCIQAYECKDKKDFHLTTLEMKARKKRWYPMNTFGCTFCYVFVCRIYSQ